MVTIDGDTYLCSGTVLNDSSTSFTPYFLTANHCLDRPRGSRRQPRHRGGRRGHDQHLLVLPGGHLRQPATPDYTLLSPAARSSLARSVDYDWALVRLNLAAAVRDDLRRVERRRRRSRAAWRSAASTIRDGDLKKASAAPPADTRAISTAARFLRVRWSSGVTEAREQRQRPVHAESRCRLLRVRGTLSGGESTCTLPQGIDDYSRFDKAYPLIEPSLAPSAQAATVPVVEFYNALARPATSSPPTRSRSPAATTACRPAGCAPATASSPTPTPRSPRPARSRCAASTRRHRTATCASTRRARRSARRCSRRTAGTGCSKARRRSTCRCRARFGRVPGRHAGGLSLRRRGRAAAAPLHRGGRSCATRCAATPAGRRGRDGAQPHRACARRSPTAATAASATRRTTRACGGARPAGSESGWGINFAHQGDIIFATWFTYDADGKPLVVVAAEHDARRRRLLRRRVSPRTGPPFNARAVRSGQGRRRRSSAR